MEKQLTDMVRLFKNFGPSRDEIEKQEGNTQSGVTDIDLTVKSL